MHRSKQMEHVAHALHNFNYLQDLISKVFNFSREKWFRRGWFFIGGGIDERQKLSLSHFAFAIALLSG